MIHLNQAVDLGLSTKEPQHYMQSMHSLHLYLSKESAKQPGTSLLSSHHMVHIANENDDTKQLQYTSNKCMCACVLFS